GFSVFVLVALAVDLGVLHKEAREVRFREALVASVMWVSLAVVFFAFVYFRLGSKVGLEFATGYLIELSLSVDNLFVFLVIFGALAVPPAVLHRVLFWGVLGALILRGIFIGVGAALINRFHWIIYIFGGFLIFTGIKLLFRGEEEEVRPENNPAVKLARKVIPLVPEYRGQNFFVVENGKRLATPLFIVLVAVEFTDLVFALDSIPAVFAVTSDPFIVYTSNIFAILGLRSFFFLLAGVVGKLRFLRYGLAFVLSFVGVKMVIVEFYKIPIGISLSVVAVLIGGSVIVSLLFPPPEKPLPAEEPGKAPLPGTDG
ncbi:MAG: TerC family protein, partial [Bdellovibrionota bacterium]